MLNLSLTSLVIEPMARINRKLEDLATKDFLTDLVNRRRFFERLETEMAETRAKKGSLSVVMFDIDFFKRVNDTYGHESVTLCSRARRCGYASCCGPSDCAARFGGEEFIILLKETPVGAAMAMAEAVRARIADGCALRCRGPCERQLWRRHLEPRGGQPRAHQAR